MDARQTQRHHGPARPIERGGHKETQRVLLAELSEYLDDVHDSEDMAGLVEAAQRMEDA